MGIDCTVSSKQRGHHAINGEHRAATPDALNKSPARAFSSLSKESATQPADYEPSKRWLAVPPANLVHLSIGSVCKLLDVNALRGRVTSSHFL